MTFRSIRKILIGEAGGVDSRGRELEITGIDLGDYFLVIHVMPTRRVKNYGKKGE
jgi:hypothetical protein